MSAEVRDHIERALGVQGDTAAALAEGATIRAFQGNSVVYYQDDPTTSIHILLRGNIRLSHISEDGFVTLFGIVTPLNSFGENGCLEGNPHCDTAFSAGATEVLQIDLAHLRPGQPHEPELRAVMGGIVARRFRAYLEFTRALYLPNLAMRLSHALFWLVREMGNEIRYQGRVVECLGPVVTQRDLGFMARGTRENVNKTLRSWERAGWIRLEDRHLLVLDRAALEAVGRNG